MKQDNQSAVIECTGWSRMMPNHGSTLPGGRDLPYGAFWVEIFKHMKKPRCKYATELLPVANGAEYGIDLASCNGR